MIRSKFIETILGLCGQGFTKLGEWPHREVVEAALAVLREYGAEECGATGTPAGEIENLHFRVGSHRVRLCVEDYGDVTLWGPAPIVGALAKRVARKLKRLDARAGGA
jgi:hypothetical protein